MQTLTEFEQENKTLKQEKVLLALANVRLRKTISLLEAEAQTLKQEKVLLALANVRLRKRISLLEAEAAPKEPEEPFVKKKNENTCLITGCNFRLK